MSEGDLDAVLSVYDSEIVFVNREGKFTNGLDELKLELTPLAAMKTRFNYDIKQVVQTGDIALMHTEWKVFDPQLMTVYAIEVARRQPDGSWCWLIGDPYTVGKWVKGSVV